MLTDKEKLNYLVACRWMNTVSSIVDVPILIFLYWLGYYNAFWILLILIIAAAAWGSTNRQIENLEKELELYHYGER